MVTESSSPTPVSLTEEMMPQLTSPLAKKAKTRGICLNRGNSVSVTPCELWLALPDVRDSAQIFFAAFLFTERDCGGQQRPLQPLAAHGVPFSRACFYKGSFKHLKH